MCGRVVLLYCAVSACGGESESDLAKTAPPETHATIDGIDCESTSATSPAYLPLGPVTVAFSSELPSNRFTCALDGEAARPCKSPTITGADTAGLHVFAVQGVRANGTVDPTPAECYFAHDTTPPVVQFAASACGNPDGVPLYAATASIPFAIVETGSGVTGATCAIDGALPTSCLTGPTMGAADLVALAEGAHTLEVSVTDGSGNIGSAMLTFLVDDTPPTVTFVSPTSPSAFVPGQDRTTIYANVIPQGTAVGLFSSSGDIATTPPSYQCSINGEPPHACATFPSDVNPLGTYDVSALTEAQRTPTIAITATDCVGNVSHADLTFFVDGNAPQLTGSVAVDAQNGSATIPLSAVDLTNIRTVACLLDHDADGSNPDLDPSVVPTGACPGLSGLPTVPDGSVAHPRQYQGEIQLTELAPGAHSLWLVVTDFWGHGAAQRFDFTIATGTGHITAIGHDYLGSNDDAAALVGNAVARSRSRAYNRVVRVLALDLGSADADEDVDAQAIPTRNVTSAINRRLRAIGEENCPPDPTQNCYDLYTWAGNSDAGDEDLAANLLGFDVLLIYDQNDSARASGIGAKPVWRSEIEAFARAGGIVIVLDGTVGGVASQTVAILGGDDPASLLATHSQGATAGPVSTGCCATDPLVAGVAASYPAPANTVSFAPVSTANAILVTPSGDPVVLDRAFTP